MRAEKRFHDREWALERRGVVAWKEDARGEGERARDPDRRGAALEAVRERSADKLVAEEDGPEIERLVVRARACASDHRREDLRVGEDLRRRSHREHPPSNEVAIASPPTLRARTLSSTSERGKRLHPRGFDDAPPAR